MTVSTFTIIDCFFVGRNYLNNEKTLVVFLTLSNFDSFIVRCYDLKLRQLYYYLGEG